MPGRIGRQLDHGACVDAGRIRSFGCKPNFRYALRLPFRDRRGKTQSVATILKNPSAADARKADTTIKIVEIYVHQHFPEASELVILNLFAYRATDTEDVKSHMDNGNDVIGPCNDYYIKRYCVRATDIILAWGGKSSIPKDKYSARINAVYRMLRPHGNKLWMVPKNGGCIPAYPLHGLKWCYESCPCRCYFCRHFRTNREMGPLFVTVG